MRVVLLGAVLVAGLAACGGSDDIERAQAPGSTTPAPMATGAATTTAMPASASDDAAASVVARTVSEMKDAGFVVDEACVAAVVEQLPTADLERLAAAAGDPDAAEPDLSEQGEDVSEGLLACLSGDADPDLVDELVALLTGSPDGDLLDEACLRERLAALPEPQLQAAVDAGPDSTDPELMGVAAITFSCADLTVASAAPVAATPAPAAPVTLTPLPAVPATAVTTPPQAGGEACALWTSDEVRDLTGIAGTPATVDVASPYGVATGCVWSGAEGEVTVIVTPDADLAAWFDEATDGDGISDGESVPAGDAGFVNGGTLSFKVGTTLVELRVFPSMAIDAQDLIDAAAVLSERL